MAELMRIMIVTPGGVSADGSHGERVIKLISTRGDGTADEPRIFLDEFAGSENFISAPQNDPLLARAATVREAALTGGGNDDQQVQGAGEIAAEIAQRGIEKRLSYSLLASKLLAKGDTWSRKALAQALRDVALVKRVARDGSISRAAAERLQKAAFQLPKEFDRSVKFRDPTDARKAAKQAIKAELSVLAESVVDAAKRCGAPDDLEAAIEEIASIEQESDGDWASLRNLSLETIRLLADRDLGKGSARAAVQALRLENAGANEQPAIQPMFKMLGGVLLKVEPKQKPEEELSTASLALIADMGINPERVLRVPALIGLLNDRAPIFFPPLWGGPLLPGPSGIRPVGRGELFKIKQQIVAYEPGEVSHVENVLAGETRNRSHRRLVRSEQTTIFERETTTEEERSLETTDRTELKRETERAIEEKFDAKGGLKVSGSYGMVKVEASAEIGYATSTREASKQAQELAREVIETARDRIVERVLERRERRMLQEVEETNQHGFEADAESRIGIYQWLDKIYRAEVFSCGERTMYDVLVPEPAAGLIAAASDPTAPEDMSSPPHPGEFDVTVDAIDERSVNGFVSRFGVSESIPDYPKAKYIGEGFSNADDGDASKNFFAETKSLTIPAGYRPVSGSIKVLARREGDRDASVAVTVGRYSAHFQLDNLAEPDAGESAIIIFPGDDVIGDRIQLSCAADDINAMTATIMITLEPSCAIIDDWKRKVFAALRLSYDEMLQAWRDHQTVDQFAAEEGGGPLGRNPARNREVEKVELQRLAIELMRNRPLWFDHVVETPLSGRVFPEIDIAALALDSPEIRFLQQAFEWENMTYLLYPYFYGRSSNWSMQTVIDDVDPKWEEFLKAGAARVQVPVRPGFELAADHYMMTGEPWLGGDEPVIGDEGFLSLYDEERARLGANYPDRHVEDEDFDVRLPTSLVKLRSDTELPRWERVDDEWLPVESGDN
ncbi:hypothetical protein [Poseidonocella sp. HB161398]|uniref:hypothetical protein n=1 Tax=Poseidonocella sp. HB161398 TaxID=2320855 RepID=UPI00110853DC|nr:hypothetical protein [Poseidonocella sp. HB161398]